MRNMLLFLIAAMLLLGLPSEAKTVHFIGDSISRGYGTGVFEPGAGDPLYVLRAPFSIGNAIADDAGAPMRFSYLRGFTASTTDAADKVEALVTNGTIQPEDIVVIEDAGPHGSNPDAYQAHLEGVLQKLTGVYRVITMKMFDYSPAPADSQYDLIINGRSTNDAIAAASANFSNVICLDMNAKMDAWKNYGNNTYLLAVMQSDGIHPNHWGNLRLLGCVLNAAGISNFVWNIATGANSDLAMRSIERIVGLAPNYAYAGSNPQYWTSIQLAKDVARKAITDP